MTALLAILADDALSTGLTLASLALVCGIVAWTSIFTRRLSRTAIEVAFLARDGRVEEARRLSRPRALGPLRAVLDGAPTMPRRRLLVREGASILVLFLAPVALLLRGFLALGSSVPAERIGAVCSLLVTGAVLVPLAAAGALAVIALGRDFARALRGACVSVLAKSVKTALDAELTEALRRTTASNDPRSA